jgi:hypothetical protein
VRSLTPAEGRVIAVLLGASAASEKERLKRAEVPRSTFHAARRRAYDEGWIRDRYVPDPVRLGRPLASFVLLRPFADKGPELEQRFSSDPSNVLTWVSPQLAFGAFLHADGAWPNKWAEDLGAGGYASTSLVLTCRLTEPEVPVFFDYEGLWANLSGLPGTVAYPTGLGGNFPGADEDPEAPTPHQRWGLTQLIMRPLAADAAGGHLVGPFGLPFSQLRLLRQGWITHRVFIDPSRVPPYQGRSADQVVFVSGALRKGQSPEALFMQLTRECRVFPFLYATNGGRMLVAALGRSGSGSGNGEGPAASVARRPVMPTLSEAMEGIDVVREPANQLRTVVDHRYDRLLPTDREPPP